MKHTIIGAGNIGTLMAAEFAAKNEDVKIYTSKPELFDNIITVYNSDDTVFCKSDFKGKITNDLKYAVEGADVIWITYPAQLFKSFANELIKYAEKGQFIGIIPGSGGAEFIFGDFIKKGCILFGFQRVHSIARLKEYGRSVYMLGRKSVLKICSIPKIYSQDLSIMAEELFDIPCEVIDNYLSITLTPSNPILHTTRLYSMFREYKPGVTYPKNFLFYEEWNDDSSNMLIKCDEELQNLCDKIPLNLKEVVSLKDYYESPTAEMMTKKISGIKAFNSITSPMVKEKDGWIPDFDSRYFVTDFSYGLKLIKDLAKIFEVDTPNIDTVWSWYVSLCTRECIDLTDISKEEILNIYNI